MKKFSEIYEAYKKKGIEEEGEGNPTSIGTADIAQVPNRIGCDDKNKKKRKKCPIFKQPLPFYKNGGRI